MRAEESTRLMTGTAEYRTGLMRLSVFEVLPLFLIVDVVLVITSKDLRDMAGVVGKELGDVKSGVQPIESRALASAPRTKFKRRSAEPL